MYVCASLFHTGACVSVCGFCSQSKRHMRRLTCVLCRGFGHVRVSACVCTRQPCRICVNDHCWLTGWLAGWLVGGVQVFVRCTYRGREAGVSGWCFSQQTNKEERGKHVCAHMGCLCVCVGVCLSSDPQRAQLAAFWCLRDTQHNAWGVGVCGVLIWRCWHAHQHVCFLCGGMAFLSRTHSFTGRSWVVVVVVVVCACAGHYCGGCTARRPPQPPYLMAVFAVSCTIAYCGCVCLFSLRGRPACMHILAVV